jgi:hypothetical protein
LARTHPRGLRIRPGSSGGLAVRHRAPKPGESENASILPRKQR